jgi:hypothetical protein
LKTAIKKKSVHLVRAYAAADSVRRLENLEADSFGPQFSRAAQTG